MLDLLKLIAEETKIKDYQVRNTVTLLFQEDCTVPFIARYRKEMTGTLDEVQIRTIRDRYLYLKELEENKVKYLKVVEEAAQKNPDLKAKLPELKAKFLACNNKQELDDLYLPFRPKRRTRAQVAREKGLESLLQMILEKKNELTDLKVLAKDFVTPENSTIDASIKVPTVEAALAGAADIYAETLSERAEVRARVRDLSFAKAFLVAKKIEKDPEPVAADAPKKREQKKSDALTYQNYFDYRESVHTAPSHRVMAVRRGEAEKFLRVTIDVDRNEILQEIEKFVFEKDKMTPAVTEFLRNAIVDSYDRLLAPSIETEIRLHLKNRAEDESMKIFTKNLEKLLLLPPIPGTSVLGVDPGFRTGSKLAVVSDTGAHLFAITVYPDFNQSEIQETAKTKQTREALLNIIKTYNVRYIAIGNGTGGRELDKLVATTLKNAGITEVKRVTVNESGASVYSTDEVAREEFPDLDPTIRSAISIARRLQDPLAELVKIDPRSIGVGQYQHDVNVTKLKNGLEEVVESCVNRVGVNLNTASYKLLAYVSGIGPNLAKSIVSYRDKSGKFESRDDLMRVTGFGAKAFQQSAGFLRVPESTNPLDATAVHPERYELVKKIAADNKTTVSDMIGKKQAIDALPWEKYVTDVLGLPTLRDIAAELQKPGRDPREDGARIVFSDDIFELNDLKPGLKLKGTVTNVTNFGAFVDIGVHQDGLVHISELSDEFIKDASQAVSVGDVLDVTVLDVDHQRKRISLSAKKNPGPRAAAAESRPSNNQQRPQQQHQKGGRPHQGHHGNSRPQQPRRDEKKYTLDDLMNKFSRK